MKFYVLFHPELGYLKSNLRYSYKWTDNLEKAKKWNQKNHPASCRTQSGQQLKKCEVVEIKYEIVLYEL